MSRILPYRPICTEKCLQSQNEALNSTFFLLRQTGPTGFVLKDENKRIFKIFLGDQHQCTCFSFQRDRELCKHICWLLLKRFRIPRTNSMVWQHGLVEREINELLRGLTNKDKSHYEYKIKDDNEINVNDEVEQRIINDDDLCPICQEELLIKKLPITYCRHGCGNNIHIKCMKVWLDHQVSIGEKMIKCPLCRENFGTPEQLKQEFRINDGDKGSLHIGYSCHRCHVCPIMDKCYKCTTCEDYYLCQQCFNSNIHKEHSFDYREKPFHRWKIAQREHLTALPNALHQMLINRDIHDNDYEILLQLENSQNTAIKGIPENIVQTIPTERINEYNHFEQCRLCLRSYHIGERVRRLPCRHKFHIDCIDGWLLHSHSTCPIDGQLVWNVGIENEQRASSSRPIRSKSASQNPIKPIVHPSKLSLLSADMGLTITPYRIRTPQPFPSPEINTRPSTGDIRRLKLVLNRNRSLSYESSHSTMK